MERLRPFRCILVAAHHPLHDADLPRRDHRPVSPPGDWPIIGGAVTLEAFLYGLSGGLAIIALLMIFATFNIAVDQALFSAPDSWLPLPGGSSGRAIAVAFVPTMVATWQSIREAQQVRGHKVRGVRPCCP